MVARIPSERPSAIPEGRPSPKAKPKAKPAAAKDIVSTAKAKGDQTRSDYWLVQQKAQTTSPKANLATQIKDLRRDIEKLESEIKKDKTAIAAYQLAQKDYKKSRHSTHIHNIGWAFHKSDSLIKHEWHSGAKGITLDILMVGVGKYLTTVGVLEIIQIKELIEGGHDHTHSKSPPSKSLTAAYTKAQKELPLLTAQLHRLEKELKVEEKAKAKQKAEAAVQAKMHTQISHHQGI